MATQIDEKKAQDAQWEKLQDLWQRRDRLNELEWADLYRLIKDFLSIEQEKFSLFPGNFPENFEYYVQRFYNKTVHDPALRKNFLSHALTNPEKLWKYFENFTLINDYWQRQDHLEKHEWDNFRKFIRDILITKYKKDEANFDSFLADKILIPVHSPDPEQIVTKAFFQVMFKNYLADIRRKQDNRKKKKDHLIKKNDLIFSIIVNIINFRKKYPNLQNTDWKPLPRHEQMAMEVEEFQIIKSNLEKFNLSNAIGLATNFVNQLTPEEQFTFNEYFIESKPLGNQKIILDNIYNKANNLKIKLRKKIFKSENKIETNDFDYDGQIMEILKPTWKPPKEIEMWLFNNGLDLPTIRVSAKNFFDQLTAEEQLLIKEHLIDKKPLDALKERVRNVYGNAAKLGVHLRKNEHIYDEYHKTRIGQWLVQSPDDNPSGLGLSSLEIDTIARRSLPPTVLDDDLEKVPDIHPEEIEDEIEREAIFMIVFQILPACALDGVDANRRSGAGPDDPPQPDA